MQYAAGIIIAALIIAILIILLSLRAGESLEISPTSGAEPQLDLKWWKDFEFTKNHNCYDYAFGVIKYKNRKRGQPGVIGGNLKVKGTPYTCSGVETRMFDDHPGDIKKVAFEDQCAAGEYKIALMVDPGLPPNGKGSDYHFMRQDSNTRWSHKPGAYQPMKVDGSKKLIYKPDEANRDLGYYNYKNMCGYYCVNQDAGRDFV